MTDYLDPLSLIPKTAFRSVDASQFQSKLTFEERCAVLGLVTAGVSRPLVAAAFSINRRTVTHICNKESVHYKDVRKKMAELGVTEFKRQFVTEDAARRVAAVVPAPPPPAGSEPAVTPTGRPSVRANRSAGIQVVHPEQCAYSHRLEIAYREPGMDEPMGWWYRDLDDKHPNLWLHNGPESLMTSQACLKSAEMNLTDD